MSSDASSHLIFDPYERFELMTLMLVVGFIVLVVVVAAAIQDVLNNEFIPISKDVQTWDDHVDQALYLANEDRRKDEV